MESSTYPGLWKASFRRLVNGSHSVESIGDQSINTNRPNKIGGKGEVGDSFEASNSR